MTRKIKYSLIRVDTSILYPRSSDPIYIVTCCIKLVTSFLNTKYRNPNNPGGGRKLKKKTTNMRREKYFSYSLIGVDTSTYKYQKRKEKFSSFFQEASTDLAVTPGISTSTNILFQGTVCPRSSDPFYLDSSKLLVLTQTEKKVKIISNCI